ncbi:MAG: exodeoxyribonuclease VII small subunit [Pseudobutyrivibrio ruminis]|nr:exodeoxyribonuclease VII small subunit [Pseudobutyrivibrio ruminis]MBO6128453.1 exodeoxyribonuclease VII small subunit [Pseudobutyrivibrio sp.]
MEENKTNSIEESFEKLEEIISKLESNEVTLDESFALYKNGMEELQSANAKIEQTKKAVMAINKAGDLEVFEEDE